MTDRKTIMADKDFIGGFYVLLRRGGTGPRGIIADVTWDEGIVNEDNSNNLGDIITEALLKFFEANKGSVE